MKKKDLKGLSEHEVIESRQKHGRNELTPPPETSIWKLYLEKFKDPIIIILLVALGISGVVGYFEGSVIESVGILVAILLATGVGFWMEYSAKKKFDILNKVSDTEPVKVIRTGELVEIPKTELVVGDVVILGAGDEIPADIELLEATDLKVSEATMTGESMAVTKREKVDGEEWNESGYPDYLVYRTTIIEEGSGVGIVIAVGDRTEFGRIMRAALKD